MGRKKREETTPVTIRLPKRLVKIIDEVAEENHRFRNGQIWSIIEEWLINNGYMEKDNRKRKPPHITK